MACRTALGHQSELFGRHAGAIHGAIPTSPIHPTNAAHHMTATLLHFVRDDSGAAIMVTSVTTVGGKLTNSFTNVSNRL